MSSSWPLTSHILQGLRWVWASPTTLLGLLIGGLSWCLGGRARRVGATVEFWGAAVTWLMRSRLIRARAMTLGHVILGVTAQDLEEVRPHEWVHVRQYERWGPFFLPAYLGIGVLLWLCGKNPYWDNPFEKEAYAADAARRAQLPEP